MLFYSRMRASHRLNKPRQLALRHAIGKLTAPYNRTQWESNPARLRRANWILWVRWNSRTQCQALRLIAMELLAVGDIDTLGLSRHLP